MSLLVYQIPESTPEDGAVLSEIEKLREDLRHRTHDPRRWVGTLRRTSEARAVQGSNTIEGYNATLSDVMATKDGEEPMEADEATRDAIAGYQEALTYVLQITQDEEPPEIDEGLLKALHYMMLKHDLDKYPGRWRPGPIYVERGDTHEIVYEGPDHESVPHLIDGMLEELARAEDVHVLVRAAMAHLNLVMIHPFKDGNGRMARCLQTLVLARERIFAPVFSSIEEYLGRSENTAAYYAILALVGQGAWNPTNDPTPWVRFCLTAHYRQALTLLHRLTDLEQMWIEASKLVERHRLPERCTGALAEAALGYRIRRAGYQASVEVTWGEPVADLTATRDLRAIVTAGLFDPIGDTRGRYYVATDPLRDAWLAIRSRRPPLENSDPYVLVEEREGEQIELPIAAVQGSR
jgi:Fic family protein